MLNVIHLVLWTLRPSVDLLEYSPLSNILLVAGSLYDLARVSVTSWSDSSQEAEEEGGIEMLAQVQRWTSSHVDGLAGGVALRSPACYNRPSQATARCLTTMERRHRIPCTTRLYWTLRGHDEALTRPTLLGWCIAAPASWSLGMMASFPLRSRETSWYYHRVEYTHLRPSGKGCFQSNCPLMVDEAICSVEPRSQAPCSPAMTHVSLLSLQQPWEKSNCSGVTQNSIQYSSMLLCTNPGWLGRLPLSLRHQLCRVCWRWSGITHRVPIVSHKYHWSISPHLCRVTPGRNTQSGSPWGNVNICSVTQPVHNRDCVIVIRNGVHTLCMGHFAVIPYKYTLSLYIIY